MKMNKFVNFAIISALFTIFVCVQCKDAPKLTIKYKKKVENCTQKAAYGDILTIWYKATLSDGSEFIFDASFLRKEPFRFTLGSKQVVKGLNKGILGMCVDEKRSFVIPPEQAYGSTGLGSVVPPNEPLFFEVTLLKIERKQEL